MVEGVVEARVGGEEETASELLLSCRPTIVFLEGELRTEKQMSVYN